MPTDSLPDHVFANRHYWDNMAADWVAAGERNWASEAAWGVWPVPNTDYPLLPDSLDGQDAIELGCGTGYVSAWMTRRGAKRVVAIDNSEQQLATARRLAATHGLTSIEFLHGNAETVPMPDGSFDFAISEYGAAIWADPYAWIPEAHRLLRPGGRLVFLGNSPIATLFAPLDGSEPIRHTLQRDYFGMHRIDWRDVEHNPGGVEFNLPISAWIVLFRDTGFEIDNYLEIRCPDPAARNQFGITAEWAHRWPGEHVWMLCKP